MVRRGRIRRRNIIRIGHCKGSRHHRRRRWSGTDDGSWWLSGGHGLTGGIRAGWRAIFREPTRWRALHTVCIVVTPDGIVSQRGHYGGRKFRVGRRRCCVLFLVSILTATCGWTCGRALMRQDGLNGRFGGEQSRDRDLFKDGSRDSIRRGGGYMSG